MFYSVILTSSVSRKPKGTETAISRAASRPAPPGNGRYGDKLRHARFGCHGPRDVIDRVKRCWKPRIAVSMDTGEGEGWSLEEAEVSAQAEVVLP